jgi:hypothetical protein
MSEQATIIWTMDSDYCDNCGIYLYDGGICDDNSGLCSFCFDQWLSEESGDEYDPEDWYNPDEDID